MLPSRRSIPTVAVILFATAGCAPGTGVVDVTVTTEDGTPFQGVQVSYARGESSERLLTNWTGTLQIRDASTGASAFEIYCPTTYGDKLPIERRSIHVSRFSTTAVRFSVPKGFCENPLNDPRNKKVPVTLRGRLRFGFEYSAFDPCNIASLNLTPRDSGRPNDLWVDTQSPMLKGFLPDTTYYVELKGTLLGPGNFGHMGGADYELVISGISKLQDAEPSLCPGGTDDAA
jgi:hypothetical protein